MTFYKCKNGDFLNEDEILKACAIFNSRMSELIDAEYIEPINFTNSTDLLFIGRKIDAMRMYRDNHDCSLREAKDAVDSLCANMNINPYDFENWEKYR